MKILFKLFLSVLFFFTTSIIFACDFCGSGSNGGSLGLLNFSNNSYFGVRYIHQSYKTNDGMYLNSPWRNEDYNTLQAYGKLNLTNRFFVSAIIPYHFHNRETSISDLKLNGIADVTILGGYKILGSSKHELQVSAGIKLPTGKFDEFANGSVNPGFQLGSGSYDYIIGVEYRFHLKKIVWINNANYNYKTENKDDYKFGDQLNLSSAIGCKIKSKGLEILPSIGLASEIYQSNQFFNRDVLNTKGDVTFIKVATDVKVKKISLGFQFQSVLNQNLNAGLVKANYRSSIYLNYNF